MTKPENTKNLVLVTTVGSDRPGIVQDISQWILEQGGNIEESRMSLLGGEFATLILVSGPPELLDSLEKSRTDFEKQSQLTVFTRGVRSRPHSSGDPSLRYDLHATSLDQQGILHHVTRVLRDHSINIVSAATHISLAPFSGAPVFQFEMEIDIPASVSVKKVRSQLEELGERENIDFILTAAT